MNKRLIIFDWDDVFSLGSREGYLACYHQAALAVGVEHPPAIERERILAKWGRPHRDEIAELLQENPELVDQACQVYEQALMSDTFTDHLQLVEGAHQLLEDLSEQYVLAIATGIPRQLLRERVFPKFHIPPLFTQIVTISDLPDPSRGKPYPDMLLAILEEQDIVPEEALMVGDAPGDIHMGQAAGVETVAVLTGLLNRHTAEEIGADHIIDTVTDLRKLV